MFKAVNTQSLYFRNHPFHLVSNNFYPVLVSLTVFALLFNVVLLFHAGAYTFVISLFVILVFLLVGLGSSIFG